jgi:outer membrane biosynthesis protein TonB
MLVMCAFGSGVLAQGTVSNTKPDSSKEQRDAKNWEVLHSMYPKRALENREEGLVGFTVKIDAAGSATECKVTHSSCHPLID